MGNTCDVASRILIAGYDNRDIPRGNPFLRSEVQYGVFSYARSTNLGDEIQSIAARQYLPRVDVLVERDRLHWYLKAPSTFIIFNGWFEIEPYWPAPDGLHPLFVAFFAERPDLLIRKEYADYYRRNAPIGARSVATVKAFEEIGVDAYFSGCLTLTLPRSNHEREDRIYAVDVDPVLYEKVVPEHIRKRAVHLSHELPGGNEGRFTRLQYWSENRLVRGVNKGMDRLGAWKIGPPDGAWDSIRRLSFSMRMRRAQELLDQYGRAKLVITSRLHCALPCLALGTPVLLVRPNAHRDPRFAGLVELVRASDGSGRTAPLNWDNPEPNSDAYLQYADALRKRCQDAVARSCTA